MSEAGTAGFHFHIPEASATVLRKAVRDVIQEEIAASEDRIYDRLKTGALSKVNDRLGGIDGRLGGIEKDIESMAEDVAKIPLIESEVRQINENLVVLRDHAGI